MLPEDDDIIVPTHYNPRLEYAIAKTLTEAAMINSSHRGLRAARIRPFNVVGPRQSRAGGFVMPTFVQQALAGRPLTVFAGGEPEARVPVRYRPRPLHRPTTTTRRSQSGKRSSTSATPPTRPTVWNLAERIVAPWPAPADIEHADARLIHGPLYEEAEIYREAAGAQERGRGRLGPARSPSTS